jgi:hypothetical protein
MLEILRECAEFVSGAAAQNVLAANDIAKNISWRNIIVTNALRARKEAPWIDTLRLSVEALGLTYQRTALQVSQSSTILITYVLATITTG